MEEDNAVIEAVVEATVMAVTIHITEVDMVEEDAEVGAVEEDTPLHHLHPPNGHLKSTITAMMNGMP